MYNTMEAHWRDTFSQSVLITATMFTLLLSRIATAKHLYVSNGSHILQLDGDNSDVKVLPMDGNKIVAMTADIAGDYLFWSDNNANTTSNIYQASLNGTDEELVVSDVGECNGLSVDWISKHLYWTDAKRKTVEMSNYDGSGRRIVARAGLDKPLGIVVDPIFGYIFWADVGLRHLERARLDGTDRSVMVDQGVTRPNQIAISYATRRVYWVDYGTQSIMSCDLNGQNVLVERDMSLAAVGSPLFGLIVIGNKAYVSAWYNTTVHSTQVATINGIPLKVATGLGKDKLYSLLSTDKSVQPKSYHPCGQERAKCSHLCLPLGGTTYRCSCPTIGGLALARNGKTCQVPEQVLFYTMKNSGEVGFVSLDGSRTPDGTIVAFSCHPTAITYDPVHQLVYWSDVLEHKIYRAKLDGTSKEVFLNSSMGVGLVEGLAFDWLHQRLYFTNTGQSLPKTDGAVYGWHIIEMITTDRQMRKTVVTDVEKPRGLALDVSQGYLYYTDWGQHPRVVSTWLDGSHPRILLDHDISNPNGLAVNQGHVYVADSNFGNRSDAAKLLVHDIAANSWKTFLAGSVKVPMGVAVRNQRLYYTDWGSPTSSDNLGAIFLHDLRFGTSTVRMLTGNKPTGLYYSPRVEPLDVRDPCKGAPCSDLCIAVPANLTMMKKYKCVCPDGDGRMLSADNKTCEVPKKFLLFADLNTIRMASFDDGADKRMKTMIHGNGDGNYVALCYDEKSEHVYWSDLTSHTIMSADLLNGTVNTVYYGRMSVDGMTMDTAHQRLYWTAYNNSTGHIARLNVNKGMETYKEIVTNLDSPRAIAIHQKKRLLFWTEYGLMTGVPAVKRAKVSGHHQMGLMETGLFWPNGLALHRDLLYVADGFYRRIHSMSLDGSEQKELTFMSGSMDHIFGLNLRGNALFYTDWFTNGTYMVDMVTGVRETIAKNLYRPTAVITHYSTQQSDAAHCTTGRHDCASVCVPLPRGYHCTCPLGQILARDTGLCETAIEPWLVTDSFRCRDMCDKHAECAQLVPSLHYHCVCKPGYHGDGEKCSVCEPDTFKYKLSNDSCTPCPPGKGTRGTMGAVDCVCADRQAKLMDGACVVRTTTPVMRPTTKQKITKAVIPAQTTYRTIRPQTSGARVRNIVPVTQIYVANRETTESVSARISNEIAEDLVPEVHTKPSGGLPYFHNCPDGETLKLVLPPGSNVALLLITWAAKDYLGHQLPMKANYPVKNGYVPLRWMGNRQDGRHIIVFEATDRWQQLVTCQFHAVVKDMETPAFHYCPHDMTIKTGNITEKVMWTRPKATDNVGVQSLHMSHEPGAEFIHGLTMVNYTAVDGAGNVASCNFTVSVVQEVNCALPVLKHGAYVCGQDPQQLQMCYLICETGYAKSPLRLFNRPYHCLLKYDIDRLTAMLKKQEPCLKRKKPTRVRQEFGLTFQGPCDSGNDAMLTSLSDAVVEYLESRHFCGEPLCDLSNVSIVCGTTTHSQPKTNFHTGRYRRETEIVAFFVVKWNITIEVSSELTQSKLDSLLLGLKLELMKLVSSMSLYVWDHSYYSVPGSVITGPVIWICQAGKVKVDGSCVKCPVGTMHNITSGSCDLCPVGTYQDAEGFLKCKLCNGGSVTAERGAIKATECVSSRSIDDMSKFLIIATCCFGFLFLCVVLFMYYHYHRQRQSNIVNKRSPLSRTNRFALSNVYAPSPILSKPKFLQGDQDTRTMGNMTNGSLYSNTSRDNLGGVRYVNADFINRDISSLGSNHGNRDHMNMNKNFSSRENMNNSEYEEVQVDGAGPVRSNRFSLQTASSSEGIYRDPERSSLRGLQNNRRPPTGRIKNVVPVVSSDEDDLYV